VIAVQTAIAKAVSAIVLALVVFDVKTKAASTDHGLEILKTVRAHLNTSDIDVAVIISVATRTGRVEPS
jgi:hypothetical protein